MNMETLLNTIINNLNIGLKPEIPVLGTLNVGEFLPEMLELQSGQKITLTINDNSQVQLNIPNEEPIALPQAEIVIDKVGVVNTPTTIEAKINQIQNGQMQLQIQNINNQNPQQYIRTQQSTSNPLQISTQTAVIKDISGLQSIQLSNVNLVEIAAPYILELPITPKQKSDIQTALRQIEIKVTIPNNNNMQFSQTSTVQQIQSPIVNQIENKIAEAIKPLPDILNQKTPVEQAEVIQNTAQELVGKLQGMIGQTFPAETIIVGKEVTFNTPLGDIRPQIPVQIPEKIQVDLEISEIFFTGTSDKATPTLFSTKIEQTLQNIKNTEPQLFSEIVKHLPAPDNNNMLQQMTVFVKAANKGDVRQWLGDNLVTQLENQGGRGQEILDNLQNALQQSHKQNISWRIIEIPYFAENHIDTIRLAIKQYPEDKDTPEEQRQKFGTRFVVDTNFTQLGAFQFDGFSVAKERRFDLVIRTERGIGNDLYANIVKLFKTTLNEVNYVGNIKINLKENFIKISENNDEDKFLPRDLFI